METGNRRVLGTHWPGSLFKMVSSRFSERSCLKIMGNMIKDDTNIHIWPLHVHSWASTPVHALAHTTATHMGGGCHGWEHHRLSASQCSFSHKSWHLFSSHCLLKLLKRSQLSSDKVFYLKDKFPDNIFLRFYFIMCRRVSVCVCKGGHRGEKRARDILEPEW